MTYEQSLAAAVPLKKMMEIAKELDVEYLTEALKQMREKHDLRESAAVLNPSPFTHGEQQELNAAKLEQLDLMLKLAENTKRIETLSLKLEIAKSQSNQLGKLFGI